MGETRVRMPSRSSLSSRTFARASETVVISCMLTVSSSGWEHLRALVQPATTAQHSSRAYIDNEASNVRQHTAHATPGHTAQSAERRMQSAVHSTQPTAHSPQHQGRSAHHTAHITQHAAHITQHTSHSAQCTVHSPQHAVHSARLTRCLEAICPLYSIVQTL